MKKIVFLFVALMALMACGNKADSTSSTNNENRAVAAANDTTGKKAVKKTIHDVQAYLVNYKAFSTTVDGKPGGRLFGATVVIKNRLYIMTDKRKNFYKQITPKGKFDICVVQPSGKKWMRLNGILVPDKTPAVKEEFFKHHENLKSMYQADDDNMVIYHVKDATARFCATNAPEQQIHF